MNTVRIECACAGLAGVVRDVTPNAGIHALCYCNDCQTFGRFLAADSALDAHGGTEMFMTAPGRIELQHADSLALMTLSPKGLHRWYCNQCHTALGSSSGAKMPFLGLNPKLLKPTPEQPQGEALIGPVRAKIFTKHAYGDGAPRRDAGLLGTLAKAPFQVLGWKLSGLAKPFLYRSDGAPIRTAQVLSKERRAELRVQPTA